MKPLISSLVFALLSGCVVMPSKWEKDSYVSPAPSVYYAPPEKTGEYQNYFIENTFISIFIRAHDETTHSGSSPFVVYFSILGDQTAYTDLIVHDLEIQTASSMISGFQLLEGGSKRGEPPKELIVPFQLTRRNPSLNGRIWFVSSPIDLDVSLDKTINVSIEVEIFNDGQAYRKRITYRFTHQHESGLFQFIGV